MNNDQTKVMRYFFHCYRTIGTLPAAPKLMARVYVTEPDTALAIAKKYDSRIDNVVMFGSGVRDYEYRCIEGLAGNH